MPANKLARYGLRHNPFSPLAPLQDQLRRAVFTSYESHLDDMLTSLLSGRACCIFGTYGMGKTFLMLESRARLKQEHPEIIPIFERALAGQDFDLTVLEGLYRHARDLTPVISNGPPEAFWKAIEIDVLRAREKKLDPMRVVRDLSGYCHDRNLIPAFLIDDVDRIHGVERLKTIVDTSRELLSLGCPVALPGNPDNPTRIIRTVGQGIFEPIVLKSLTESQFKLMVSRYLATARSVVSSIDDSLVFVCYAEEDRKDAELLYGKIKDLGYRPWMASRDILPGEDWRDSIDKAIRRSSFFLACISKNSVAKRGFIQSELKAALDRARKLLTGDIYIIPIMLDDSLLPEGIAMLQAADTRVDNFLQKLATSFRRGLELRNTDDSAAPPVDLRPFDEETITYIIRKVDGITPRMLMTACGGFLNLAADDKCETITAEFVEKNWSYLGANILANEANLDSLIAILLEIAEKNGEIDEEVDLRSLQKMLQGTPGKFSDLVRTVQEFEDIMIVRDEDGLTKISLNPLISRDFLKEDFAKTKLDDFRRRFGGGAPLIYRTVGNVPPEGDLL